MSELRDELEKNFASAAEQSEENAVNSEESDFNHEPENVSVQEEIAAPKSYTKKFQESFKKLSPEWQKYLLDRERQMEKGFSEMGNKLNASRWVDKFFEERKERLKNQGFEKAQDYVAQLISVDDALHEKPLETLTYLAQIYGVQEDNNHNNASGTEAQEKMFRSLMQAERALQKRQNDAVFFDVNRFENAVNDNGELKHPYYEKVKNEMISTLKGGEALNLEEAYQKALWLNESVRDKMIEEKINSILSQKFDEALKAKEISFSPKSKAEVEPKELTLREELEAQFRKEF